MTLARRYGVHVDLQGQADALEADRQDSDQYISDRCRHQLQECRQHSAICHRIGIRRGVNGINRDLHCYSYCC